MSDAVTPDMPVDSLTYEEARDQLVAIVARLETGAATLDESLGLWERGEELAARCQTLLDGARTRIETAQQEREQGLQEDGEDAS